MTEREQQILEALNAYEDVVPAGEMTRSGYPSVHFIATLMPKGFDPSAEERTVAWDAFMAKPADPTTGSAEFEDPDAQIEALNQEPGGADEETGAAVSTVEGGELVEAGQLASDQPPELADEPAVTLVVPREDQEIVAKRFVAEQQEMRWLYLRLELAASAAWNAMRTVLQAERNDRYALPEWSQADNSPKSLLIACLRSEQPCALDDVLAAEVDPRLLPIARGILSVGVSPNA